MNAFLENAAWFLSLVLSVVIVFLVLKVISRSRFNEHLERGKDLLEEGRRKDAIDEFNRCVVIDPKNPEGYMARGEAFFQEGLHEDALDDFQRALSLSPEGPWSKTATIKIAGIRKGKEVLEALGKKS